MKNNMQTKKSRRPAMKLLKQSKTPKVQSEHSKKLICKKITDKKDSRPRSKPTPVLDSSSDSNSNNENMSSKQSELSSDEVEDYEVTRVEARRALEFESSELKKDDYVLVKWNLIGCKSYAVFAGRLLDIESISNTTTESLSQNDGLTATCRPIPETQCDVSSLPSVDPTVRYSPTSAEINSGEECLSLSIAAQRKLTIKFLRRKRPTSFKFLYPLVDDIQTVQESCVICKIPYPVVTGGTARVAAEITFPVDLSSYKNLR